MFQAFIMSFFPLFIAMDMPMAIPIFASMTAGRPLAKRRQVADEAILTALLVGAAFLVLGRTLFGLIGITESDFRVGGGILLLVISVSQLAVPQNAGRSEEDGGGAISGASPLGIPLIMGPASITTILLAGKSCGLLATFLSICLNLLILWLSFRCSQRLIRHLGLKSMQVLAKIASLALVSIGVMMIRVGLRGFFPT